MNVATVALVGGAAVLTAVAVASHRRHTRSNDRSEATGRSASRRSGGSTSGRDEPTRSTEAAPERSADAPSDRECRSPPAGSGGLAADVEQQLSDDAAAPTAGRGSGSLDDLWTEPSDDDLSASPEALLEIDASDDRDDRDDTAGDDVTDGTPFEPSDDPDGGYPNAPTASGDPDDDLDSLFS